MSLNNLSGIAENKQVIEHLNIAQTMMQSTTVVAKSQGK